MALSSKIDATRLSDLAAWVLGCATTFKEASTVVTRPGGGIIPAAHAGNRPARARWRRYPALMRQAASRWLEFL